jgi:hypothetical protein
MEISEEILKKIYTKSFAGLNRLRIIGTAVIQAKAEIQLAGCRIKPHRSRLL